MKHMFTWALVVAVCGVLLPEIWVRNPSWGILAAEELPEAFRKLSPSVGALYVQETSGNLQYNCTVTAVGRYEKATVVLTAFHCVEKGQAYLVTFDGRQFYGARVWKLPRWHVDDVKFKKKWGEPDVDMALFLLDNVSSIAIVALGDDQSIQFGERIVTVGFPLGITKTRYEGIIAGRLDKLGADRHGYLILQIFGAPGSSGTSVVSLKTGKVLGVLVGASQSSVGLPVIYATPLQYQTYLMEVPR